MTLHTVARRVIREQALQFFPIITAVLSNEHVHRLAPLIGLRNAKTHVQQGDPGAFQLVGLASPLPHFHYMAKREQARARSLFMLLSFLQNQDSWVILVHDYWT